MSRVVTNAYWAQTYDKAIERLKPLVDAGLTEINFSTGDNHQKFVPFKNIINATKASYDLGLKPICISIETPPKAKFTIKDIENNAFLHQLIAEKHLLCMNASWMTFKQRFESETDSTWQTILFIKPRPCSNILTTIAINPYSQLLACCGLTVEYNPYLKLGNVDTQGVKALYEKQFNDIFKIWLHLDGPEKIYEQILEKTGEKKTKFPHECAYCMEIIKKPEYIEILKNMLESKFQNIIYRYKLKHSKLTYNFQKTQ
jgi:hypothetical protein